MKELFNDLKRTKSNKLVLLDTCFFIDVFTKGKEKQLEKLIEEKDVALTSFNAEELIHVIARIKHKNTKHLIRSFVKKKKIMILDIPVHPGNQKEEEKYVREVDPYLIQDVPDPSDAVLIAAAIRTQSTVLTKDKHHLFTAILKNYLDRWGIGVYKEFKDV